MPRLDLTAASTPANFANQLLGRYADLTVATSRALNGEPAPVLPDAARKCPDCGYTYHLDTGCTYCHPATKSEPKSDFQDD